MDRKGIGSRHHLYATQEQHRSTPTFIRSQRLHIRLPNLKQPHASRGLPDGSNAAEFEGTDLRIGETVTNTGKFDGTYVYDYVGYEIIKICDRLGNPTAPFVYTCGTW